MRRAPRHSVGNRKTNAAIAALGVVLLAMIVSGAPASIAASTTTSKTSTTNVRIEFASASDITVTGCPALSAGVTDFGDILPNTSNITTTDCAVTFGSSNDTAMLKLAQTDMSGSAMWLPTTGELDTTFDGPAGGANGKFIEPIGGSSDSAEILLAQTDGKLIAIGSCWNGANYDFCLARYNIDGSRDTAFDGPGGAGNGEFIEPIGTASDMAHGAAIQSDGKIVVGGNCYNGANDDFCLARYNTDGSRDTTFDGPSGGGDGEFLEPIGTSNDSIFSVTVQTDGKIVAAGACYNGTDYDLCLARYNSDGSRDTAFDGPSGTANGEFLEPISTGNDEIYSVALQSDGKILAAGYCRDTTNNDFCFARYNSDGSRDTAFDGPSGTGNGEFLEPIGTGADRIRDLQVQSDGKLIAVGSCDGASDIDFCLARYNTDGSRDTAFDGPSGAGNGEFIEPVGAAADTPYDIQLLPDGRSVASGICSNGTDDDFCVARYETDGSRDVGLDGTGGAQGNGEMIEAVGGAADYAYAAQLLPDGQMALAGTCASDFCLMKLDTGSAVNNYDDDNAGSDYNWSEGTNMFGACLHTVANNASGGGGNGWTVAGNGNCTTAISANWNPIAPTTGTAGARVATSLVSQTTNATANLRFGLRTPITQKAGTYLGPLTFEVTAPNV